MIFFIIFAMAKAFKIVRIILYKSYLKYNIIHRIIIHFSVFI